MKPPTRTPMIVAVVIAAFYLFCFMAAMRNTVSDFGKMVFHRVLN